MAFRGTVQKQVQKALKIIGDLGVTVTIAKKTNEAYDIATATVTTTTSSASITTQGLQEGVRRESSDSASTLKSSLLLDSKAVGALDGYDLITISTVTWDLVSYIDDGYVTTCELRRQL
mgnify:CR=1 FL=1